MLLRTPGVYTQEISTLPPSVAEVSTAVPAFIGYVERGRDAARIGSVLEYQTLFGTAKPASFTARVTSDDPAVPITFERTRDPAAETLFYAVQHYFANGGGPCWIVPVPAAATKAAFKEGLDRIEREDEPTLLLFPQAADRLGIDDYATLAQDALAQCNRLKDRFTILDVPATAKPTGDFRDKVSSSYLSYGAAYYPYLDTTLGWVVDDASVIVERSGTAIRQAAAADRTASPASTPATGTTTTPATGTTTAPAAAGTKAAAAGTTPAPAATASQNAGGATLAALKAGETALYGRIREALARERVTLPPSAAVAGAYAAVDRDRGVWKAPANVALAATIGPVDRLTDADQEGLNVDETAGKSINAIRVFAGRGTVIWGARTLAGNDNEWRFVPVRRLFITVEESTRKASAFAVFEPNDATTWLKVKGMIESYLFGLWERGALAGSKPDQAYYVHVGLGSTMTAQDVLEGRMIVEIGIAAVRPAEFVVLRFSHRLQQA